MKPCATILATAAIALGSALAGTVAHAARYQAPTAQLTGALAQTRQHQPPRAQLTGALCVQGRRRDRRSFTVTAVMRPVPGTRSLEVRFKLLQRLPGGSFKPVAGPGLGDWISPSQPTLGRNPGDVWYVRHPVSGLRAPADYRFQVSFRWLGRHRAVLHRAFRGSAVCAQHADGPRVAITSIAVDSASPPATVDEYTVELANTGTVSAGPLTVRLAGSGQVVAARLRSLPAHGRATVKLTGPVCDPASPPVVRVLAGRPRAGVRTLVAQGRASCPVAGAGGFTG